MLHYEAEKEEIMMEAVRQRSKTYDLVYVSIFVVLIAVCSWISIPLTVPVTLQTFGVFIAVGLLGGKRGTLAVLVYILMGAIGIPVFSGFTGGIGILAGNDIVAIEQATLDLIDREELIPNALPPGWDLADDPELHLFERIHHKDPYAVVRYLEELGCGTTQYELEEVE